ncbi:MULTISPECIES: heme exporter protein CcmB [Thalassospira]|jgi:heme exporter protein B|uniref:Heme exporter protein B n=1 Tax=Thalassospira povalilytica TaxID=732237 RepID=A0A8I1M5Z6_9PROT|nr:MULTISPECIES: heme exporter protein CcmB [Thalassospira]MEE3047226.1 heme exporter protein CcmB [Pseudomonadota bacterium]RCK26648.1 heme transporter [Thalassospira profundimaris]MBN8195812.1 heme exporter protein CcmB [Thalassospira povalilytica]MBO6769852.1 heme exporter protein CcmB [Thalassospira sp.]MCC4239379.1 heme exporter protein CcmB [Thalassospira povalilytica]
MNGFLAILQRDLRLALRQGADSVMVVAFFIVTTTLFPFGVGPEANILARIASGVIWVSALLAAMLSLERVFQTDYEDGTLELLTLSPVSLELLVLGKVCAHWLTTGLPLIIAAPLMAVMLNMDQDGFVTLMLAMLLGTPALSLIGAIGAALILGARRGGVLVSLLVLPLYIPVLIFGAGAVEAALLGISATAQLQIMAAILLIALAATPFATAHAVRQAME